MRVESDIHWRERLTVDVLNRIFPRMFQARWQDEDAGWKTMCVIAADKEHARRIVEPIAGPVEVQVYAV